MYVCREVTSEEKQVVRGVVKGLVKEKEKAGGAASAAAPAKLKEYWGNYLFHINDIPFQTDACPNVFTQFRKLVESKSRVRKVIIHPSNLVLLCLL